MKISLNLNWRKKPQPSANKPPISLIEALPKASHWQGQGDFMLDAQQSLAQLGLEGWQIKLDKAFRRLGSCDIRRKTINLSRYFLEHYLAKPEGQQSPIRDVLLHEIAHALAWKHHGARGRGHGAIWRRYCSALGIPHERACRQCDPFEEPYARYALMHQQTRQIVRYYLRQPRRSPQSLKRCYIPGQKESSLGQLIIVSLPLPPET